MRLEEVLKEARIYQDQYVARKSWKNRRHIYCSYGYFPMAKGNFSWPSTMYFREMLAIGIRQVRHPDTSEVKNWHPYVDDIIADDWFIGNEKDKHTQDGKLLKLVISDDGLRYYEKE